LPKTPEIQRGGAVTASPFFCLPGTSSSIIHP
jgi:hypothetical protein